MAELKVGDKVLVAGATSPVTVRAVGKDNLLVARDDGTVFSVPRGTSSEMTFEQCLSDCVRMAAAFSMRVELQQTGPDEFEACARHWSIDVRPEFEVTGLDLDTAVTQLRVLLADAHAREEANAEG